LSLILSSSIDADYAHDALAEVTKEWRVDWGHAGSDKKKYSNTLQPFYLNAVEKLLDRFKKVLDPKAIGVADVMIFGQLRDDRLKGFDWDRTEYKRLTALYEKVASNPMISAWCAAHGGI